MDETQLEARRHHVAAVPTVAAEAASSVARTDTRRPAAGSVRLSGSILVICTANVIRSPVAAGLLRRGLQGSSVTVDSAGVAALAGRRIAPEILQFLPEGLRDQMRTHESQGLNKEMSRSADVILTATRRQRSAVLSFAPTALKRTFTLGEFAAWTTELAAPSEEPRGTAPWTVAEVVTMLPTVRAVRRISEAEYDIPDPVGGSTSSYRRAYGALEMTTAAISSALVSLSRR